MITAFLPCRAGSERVHHKNTRVFAGFQGGLLELKLRQLDQVSGLDRVLVSSNDLEVLRIATEVGAGLSVRVEPLSRPDRYGLSSTSMEAFIGEYVARLEGLGTILWTHVTHPLMTAPEYSRVLESYRQVIADGYDSLATVTKVQDFLWKDGQPFNYDPTQERWPRTQDLEPLYLINHAAYVIDALTVSRVGDRVGRRPHLLEITAESAFDIDWPGEFELADEIVSSRRQATPSGPRLPKSVL